MNDKNISKQIEFANITGMLAGSFSLNPTVGQIYGLLYLSQNPVSLNDMVTKLGISKGAVSTNVRILESWGAVTKVWVDNSRKDYYEANPDVLNIIIRRVSDGLNKRLENASKQIKQLNSNSNTFSIKPSENDEFFEKRMNNLSEVFSKVEEFLELLSR